MAQNGSEFDLDCFLPYLLNQAAEATSQGFQAIYKERHGMTRTQWRVLAHVGKFGTITARQICANAHIEKTKVSRAIRALENADVLVRVAGEDDRRTERLSLTQNGKAIYAQLGQLALNYDEHIRQLLGLENVVQLESLLHQLRSMTADTGKR
ncbi:MarR Transcriptional regulators [Rhabdaerophilaceae bacterium]